MLRINRSDVDARRCSLKLRYRQNVSAMRWIHEVRFSQLHPLKMQPAESLIKIVAKAEITTRSFAKILCHHKTG